MLSTKIALAWIIGLVVVAMFVSLRVVVPGLMNMQNDGAMIFAVLLIGATLTAPFILYVKVIKPILNEEL